jgi:ribosomal subunit interface protein
MHKRITFRNMDHSEVLEAYADKQLERIIDFVGNEPTPIYLDLILEPSKVHSHHRIECRLKTPNYDLVSNYEGADFYDVLDRVIDIMYRQLLNEKQKQIDERKTVGRHDEFKKQR